jgi:plastocyanin
MHFGFFQRALLLSSGIVALAVTGCGERVPLGPIADADAARGIRDVLSESSKSEAGTPAAAATGSGWATLSGRFIHAEPAAVPKMLPYNVTKDEHICMEGGKSPLQQTLLVDSTGGIKNVVIFLRNASRVHDSAKPSTEPIVFDQKECVFLSHVMGVTVGQTIDIKNSDPTGHNTKVDGQQNKFNQTIENGKQVAYVMQKEEAKPADVSCSIHPWMKAYLLPRSNGYFAVTAADGTFKIANLPAGEELEFQVWHESAAGNSNSLVPGTPETKVLKWTNRGRFKITLQPNEPKEISISVPASAFKG